MLAGALLTLLEEEVNERLWFAAEAALKRYRCLNAEQIKHFREDSLPEDPEVRRRIQVALDSLRASD